MALNVDFTSEQLVFQKEVRSFFENKFPLDIKNKMGADILPSKDDHVRWQKILFKQGWAAVNWPEKYGGTGWDTVQKYIYANEMARVNAPDVVPFGVKMVGPVIYNFGTTEQCNRFLPDILASNTWWCQGYSEPGAGSDLASLKMRAERDGDIYIVTGTKTWTTLAQHADWIFCLVRTNSEVERRQQGISCLLIEMNSPGIEVRPIITLDGIHEINEVNFENVRVPVDNLIGEVGKGWTYGKVLLQYERTNIALVARSSYRLKNLKKQIAQSLHGGAPLSQDRNFSRRLARVEIELKALEYTELRTLADVAVGKSPGPESSILKIQGTEVRQAIDELYMIAAGYYALPYVPQQHNLDFPDTERIGFGSETNTSLVYFNHRKASIYGGSNEIQKNIIAKHVLGL